MLRAQGMKSDKNLFFCQIYVISFGGKMVHVVIDTNFSLFVKGLKIFLNPSLSLIDPPMLKWVKICNLLFANFG